MNRDRNLLTPEMVPPRRMPSAVRVIGSLWFGAITLVLVLVVMAAATVYESGHSTERALTDFYRSWWFSTLLALVAVSVIAVLVLRFPFRKRQIGFVLTHASVLLILAGALVTEKWGIDGTLELAEGETRQEFDVRQDALSVVRIADGTRAALALPARVFAGARPSQRETGPLVLGDLTVTVDRYLPHSEWRREVVNDSAVEHPAVEVTLTASTGSITDWVFADQSATFGPLQVAYRRVTSTDEWQRLMSDQGDAQQDKGGIVRVSYNGQIYEIALDACLAGAAAVGETGLSVRVHQYLPHAVVGPDNKVISASEQPVNPAIEVEVTGAAGAERRFAFAKFPDFRHGEEGIPGLNLTFIAPTSDASTPIQIVSNAEGQLYARFSAGGGYVLTQRLEPGAEVETPFPDCRLAVMRRFDRARIDWQLVAADPDVPRRNPAIRASLAAGDEVRMVWLQKYRPRAEVIGGASYELGFGASQIPLDFKVTLDRFRIGRYPGTMRPRSFESQITITDPTAGGAQSRVVSMNNPASYGGYTFFQSSYRQEAGRSTTVLSVAADPGQPIVFAGYILMLVGMVVVLVIRVGDRRQATAAPQPRVEARRVRRKENHHSLVRV
ncbi:MAG: hypothetical protein C4547_12815 [Phycisphaerales bacterium]|nr:MAG: hypothetical protein C4547_12815 [Phycisphaerales bacterium]